MENTKAKQPEVKMMVVHGTPDFPLGLSSMEIESDGFKGEVNTTSLLFPGQSEIVSFVLMSEIDSECFEMLNHGNHKTNNIVQIQNSAREFHIVMEGDKENHNIANYRLATTPKDISNSIGKYTIDDNGFITISEEEEAYSESMEDCAHWAAER